MSNFMPPKQQQAGGAVGAAMPAVGLQAAEVVPLPEVAADAGEGATIGGFMSKFQVHFPHTGNDNPARRITSGDHTDSQGWTWRLVLHPWGHDARGCYSAFLELVNADSLPAGFSRYVKLEFAMHAWDAAYHVEPNKTQFLLHKFNAQATDFGYTRAFEHDYIMAQRNIFIDPQGFVRISVKIIDVREAYFRVATDADLARSVTGRGGGGDFADWRTCLPAKSFKHDQLLYVIQKVSELTGVPLISCRPWLCMPRSAGAIRPVAALLPQHLQMTICEALGDRPQYHIYLEEVDTLPEVWDRRRAVPGGLPTKEAGELLLNGRAYAQLPNEVYLVFLKIDRRILAARVNGHKATAIDALHHHKAPGSEPEFVFIGKAMAHKTDRGCDLVPIARNLAHLPDTINLEVFEQLAPEEVRRFSGEKTVQEAGLTHGSVLLFRSAQQEPPVYPPNKVPPATASSIVPFNPATATATASTVAKPAPSQVAGAVPAKSTPKLLGPKNALPVGNPATAALPPLPPPAGPGSGVAAPPPRLAAMAAAAAAAAPVPSPSASSLPPRDGQEPKIAHGGDASNACQGAVEAPSGTASSDTGGGGGGVGVEGKNRGENNGATVNAAGDGTPGARVGETGTGAGVSAEVSSAGGAQGVLMDAEAQRRATCLALYQVQENARQRNFQDVARRVTKQLVAKASRFAPIAPRLSRETGGSAAAATAKLDEGKTDSVGVTAAVAAAAGVGAGATAVTEAAAAAAAGTGTEDDPPRPAILTPAEKATVAAAAKMAAAEAAAKHMVDRLAAAEAKTQAGRTATVSITDALSQGAPPPPATPAVEAPHVSKPADGGVRNMTVGWQSASPPKDAGLVSDNRAAPAAAPPVAAGGAGTMSGEDTESDEEESSPMLPTTVAAAAAAAAAAVVSENSDVTAKKKSSKDWSPFEVDTPEEDAADVTAAATEESHDESGLKTDSNVDEGGELEEEEEEAAGPQTPSKTRETRAARASRVERTAAAEEEEAERPDTTTKSPTSVTEAVAGAAAAVPVEQQRRSSRKAAAVASHQMRCSARAGSRGAALVAATGSSPAAVAAATVLFSSSRGDDGGGRDGGSRDGSGGAASGGVGEVAAGARNLKVGGSPEKSSVKRAAEGVEGGPRKTAKNAGGEDKSEQEILGTSDLPSLITQMINVPGFTADKCLQIARSKEMAEIANAIATIGNDEPDSFRSRQLERLLAIKEKEAQSSNP